MHTVNLNNMVFFSPSQAHPGSVPWLQMFRSQLPPWPSSPIVPYALPGLFAAMAVTLDTVNQGLTSAILACLEVIFVNAPY